MSSPHLKSSLALSSYFLTFRLASSLTLGQFKPTLCDTVKTLWFFSGSLLFKKDLFQVPVSPNTSLLNDITQHHYLTGFQLTVPPSLSTKIRKHLKRSLSNKAGPHSSECVGPLVPASPRQPVPRSERAAASPEVVGQNANRTKCQPDKMPT